jgi:uncharacterized protein DUF3617
MNRLVLLLACIAPLAACNKSPQVDLRNASVGEVAEKAREAGANAFINPGQWQTKVTVKEMSFPGMAPELQASMKGIMGQNVTVEHCISAEEAKRPSGRFFTGKEPENCRYDRFSMGGGKIDAVMRCESKPSGSMTMTVSGTYTPDSSTTSADMSMSGGGQGGMRIKSVTENRRIGACTGKPDDVKITMHGDGQ